MTTKQYALPSTQTISRQTLANGLTILVYENPAVESVVVNGSLRTGSVYEDVAQNGLASMTAASLMRGTKTRDFDRIHTILEDIGAEFDCSAGKFRTNFNGRALAEDLPVLVDILADILRNPIFPQEELDEERNKRLTELKYAQTDTRYMATRRFRETLYPADHPYHYSTYGSLDTLPLLQRAEVEAYHARQYGPDGMIIVIVGAVKKDEVITSISDALGDWSNADQAPTPNLVEPPKPQEIKRVESRIPGKTQSDIVMGTHGPSRFAADYIPASLANSILGEFGMMGRVGNIIREKLGLAYYAYSRVDAGEGPGAWHITAGVSPENVELAVEKVRFEINRLCTELVSETDLDDNQSYFTGRLPLRLESNHGLAATLHALEEFDLGLDYLINYRETIYSVTREMVLEATRHYLHPDHLVVSVAKPA